jgi:Mn2+/Fe2+ NRAMP family transporter
VTHDAAPSATHPDNVADELVIPVSLPPIDPLVTAPLGPSSFVRLLQCFGPAAIAASVSIGAGETILVVRAGAWSAYQLMWVIALSCLCKGVFLTYLLGRYTVISGEPIAQRLSRLPGPRGWFLWTVLLLELVTAPLYWTPIAKPCGALVAHLLLPSAWASPEVQWWCQNLLATALVLAAIKIGFGMSFQNLEREQVILCGVLVAGTMAGTVLVFLQRPGFVDAVLGLIPAALSPAPWADKSFLDRPSLAIATLFAYVGNTTLGYVVYANWVGMHRWGLTAHPRIDDIVRRAADRPTLDHLPTDPAEARALRQTARLLRWDAVTGALVVFFVSASFLASGAAVLYPRQAAAVAAGLPASSFAGWSLLTDQATVWNEIHPALVWVYYVVIFVALWGTLQSFPEIYIRVAESFHQAMRPGQRAPIGLYQRWIAAWMTTACLTLIWTGARFELMTEAVGFITNGAGVALMMLAALYLDFRLPAPYRTRRWVFWMAVASAVVLVAMSATSGVNLWNKLAG